MAADVAVLLFVFFIFFCRDVSLSPLPLLTHHHSLSLTTSIAAGSSQPLLPFIFFEFQHRTFHGTFAVPCIAHMHTHTYAVTRTNLKIVSECVAMWFGIYFYGEKKKSFSKMIELNSKFYFYSITICTVIIVGVVVVVVILHTFSHLR